MIDVWLQHSIYCDYPVWRVNMLQRHRDRFAKIILYPSDHNREHSYWPFLKEHIKETWCDPIDIDWNDPKTDWRQVEVEPMFPYSDAEWVYFTEQDWFVRDYQKFYDAVEDAISKGADAIGWWNDTGVFPYLHPSCFFIKREVLEKTQKDFRAHPEIQGSDHFATLSRDLEKLGAKIITTEDLGFKYWEDCFHLGGLTQNYIDTTVIPDYKFHRPDIFYVYNWWSRQVPTVRSKDYLDLSCRVEELVKQRHPEEIAGIDPATSKWAEFFK